MELNLTQKIAFGIGAVGKDIVYALSSTFVMYYYQELLHLDPVFVGAILMIARIFDALNDPFMGVLVAKTKTRWGRFRPWLFTGTILNAFVLYALFAAPSISGAELMIYFSVVYIMWGVTYTMMDIPYWSMIPAVTKTTEERENLSVVGRTCAGVGSALVSMFALKMVGIFGGDNERLGFQIVGLAVAIIFVIAEVLCCIFFNEKSKADMKTSSVKEMFKALFANDQALTVVVSLVLINAAFYLTSNFIIYFFKYDFSGQSNWKDFYTIFVSVGGLSQILGMMIVYPILRKKLSNTQIFKSVLTTIIAGFALLLAFIMFGLEKNIYALIVPAVIVFASNGILTVLTTVFLSNSVDYGELKSGHREESVIFSMQTFLVKAASGISVFLCGVGLKVIGLVGNADETGPIVAQSTQTLIGLRLIMTVIPMLFLGLALFYFIKKFILTDAKAKEIADKLKEIRG